MGMKIRRCCRADVVRTIISSLLPVVAVVVLSYVRNMLRRQGLVALFTVVLSLFLIIVTRAKRIKIFALRLRLYFVPLMNGGLLILGADLLVCRWVLWAVLLFDIRCQNYSCIILALK